MKGRKEEITIIGRKGNRNEEEERGIRDEVKGRRGRGINGRKRDIH